MTNKPMLSVERELLERAASAIEKHYGSLQWVIASELRALLDKEVDFLTPDCPDCACVQDGHCLCIPSKPAAQHQGDPVCAQIRYRRPEKGCPDWGSWHDLKLSRFDKNRTHYIDNAGWECQTRVLFAEQSLINKEVKDD